ncbi:hypothetical protein XEULMG905_23020, partial [Xanthomonas euvesicatoria]
LLYAGRSRSAMAYVDTLEALLGERLQLQCDDSAGPPDLAAELARLSPNAEVYVCGPALSSHCSCKRSPSSASSVSTYAIALRERPAYSR